jgi:hypothetical protein
LGVVTGRPRTEIKIVRVVAGDAGLRGNTYAGRSADTIARRLFGRSAEARPHGDPNNRGQGYITRTDRHGTHVLADYVEYGAG